MRVARAPGRVNLIGDHTDYQQGFCLPMAIDREVLVRFGAGDAGRIRVRGDDGADLSDDAFVRAVVDAVGVANFDAEIASTVPIGAGLSSSAAFSVALLLAASEVAGAPLEGRRLALAAQSVEQRATGVPCGVMDQMASVFGRSDHALLLDCRSLDVTPVPIPDNVDVLLVHSGVPRRLGSSEYARRRAACEAAATRLGVGSLRDADASNVADDPVARHVVSENARVLAFVDALQAGDLARCGALMIESHTSLRDDFHVSTLELDALVDQLVRAGAYGARLTGAGFGGCAVALVERGRTRALIATLTKQHWLVRASDGASIGD